MKFWKILLAIVLMASVSDVVSGNAFARGGRSRPSRSSPSRSRPSRSPSKSKPSSSRSTRAKSTTSKRTKSTVPKRSAADQKAYNKAKASGTAFSSRSAATSNFKSKHADKYKSTYATKPATRPSHVPESTKVGGTTYNVTYNQQHGGYGYMGPSGSWMMYDAMTDVVVLSMLMRQNDYYYDAGPLGEPGARRGGLIVFFVGVGVLTVIVVAAVIINKSGEGMRR